MSTPPPSSDRSAVSARCHWIYKVVVWFNDYCMALQLRIHLKKHFIHNCEARTPSDRRAVSGATGFTRWLVCDTANQNKGDTQDMNTKKAENRGTT